MDFFHVVIDTSVLRQAHFQHPDFKRLLRLSQKGLIKIYIPQVVLEEERTNRLDSLHQTLDEIDGRVKKLTDRNLSMLIQGLAPPTVQLWSKEEVSRNSRVVFESFLAENKIELIAVTQQQADGVLRRYFEISPPFDVAQRERTKRREDFPDAWILEAALEVKARKGRHCALVGDGKLKAAFAAEKFEIFASVESLIEEVERFTATIPLRVPGSSTVKASLKELRRQIEGLDEIVLGMNEALNSPSKDELFSTLERVGISRALAEHEARTLVLLGIATDTGSHLIPADRAQAAEAAGTPAVHELLLKALL